MGMVKTTTDVKGLTDAFGVSKKSVISYISGIKDGTIAIEDNVSALQGYQSYLKSTSTSLTLADVKTKALSVSMKVLSTIGWMAIFTAASWAIGKGIEAIENYIHRLDNAKETLASTESDLSSVKSEIETITDKIKELEAMDSLSITDKEDLQRLKDQNEELRIRQQYLEKQKQYDAEKVADYTKEKYNSQYGSTTQEDVDKYRSLYGNNNKNTYTSVDEYGAPTATSYYAGNQTDEYGVSTGLNSESKDLANLIAQYQYYQEEKAKAVTAQDQESVDKWDAKLKETSKDLMGNRTTLQGFSDDLYATGESSAELDGITEKLKLIDDLLLSPGQKLVNFINSDALKEDKEQLVALADSGKLTAKVLSDNFSNVDGYLKENGLTIEDLISVVKTYKDELATTGDGIKKSLSKEDVISNINSLSEGFESLDKIMNSMSGKDPFDYSLLDDKKFKENFGELGEDYEDFVEKVSSSPKDIKATQSAFDNLVTTWIDSSGILDGLTEDNANLATAMLSNMGVANAEEVVVSRLAAAQEHLAAQKAYTADVSNELANATANEIPAILDEATNSDIAKVALAGLVLEKQFFNGNSLNTSGDIENILSLVGVIGTANKALQALNAVKSGKVGAGSKADYDSIVSAAQKEAEDAIAAAANYKGKGSATNTIYDGGTKTNKSSGSGSKDKADTTKQIDWVKRYLDMLNDERQELVDSASKYSSEYTQQIIALDKQILPETQKAVETYKKAWEDAASKLSKSDRAKVELGYTDIETYSGDNADNIQAAIDSFDKYQDMQKQYAEAEKASNETLLTQYDADIANLENKNEALASQNSLIESQIDYYKEIGSIVSASDYATMLDNVGDEIDNVNGKISDLKLKLNLARELYGSNSEEYDDVKDAISDAEDELYSLNKKQAQYNKTLAEMPITNLSTIISMYEDIGNKIENYGKMATATGQKLNTDYYQKLISNQSTVLDQYKKQITEIKSLMSEYEKGSDNWQELYDQLQSIDSSMASIVENMAQLNEELLQMPLDSISTLSDSLQKVITGLTSVQDEYDTILSAVNNGIQDRIDLLGEEQEKASDAQQTIINGLQDELDLLQKTNEARERQLAVEQDEYDLAKAQGQRNVATVRNGIVDYENDSDAIRDAQEALANSKEDLAEYNLEQQIDDAKTALDNLNDSYQDQIDALQEIADKWSEISSIQSDISNADLATSILGEGWLEKIISGNDSDIYETLSSLYQTNAKQLDEYQKQADSTANIQSLIEDYINSYKSGEITYTQALTGINNLLSQTNESMSAMDNLQNIYDYLGTVNGVGADADSILKGIQSGLATTADELVKSLEQYNENAGTISEYTSSWQQLTDNVASMLDVLKDVRDNLKDSEDNSDDDDDDNDNTRYGGGKDGSPGTPGKGEYVNSGPGVSRKDGITRGLIGSTSDSDREASMKLLGLKKLDPDEIPAVLHMGEAVFNKEQQNKLLENFGTAWNYKPSVPDYSSLLSNVNVTNKTETPTITLNGGINIQKSDTPDELAKGIMDGKLGLALGQRLGKR